MVATREKLHALIDVLPEPELRTAQKFLEYLRWESEDAPARLPRSAPIDDEPTTKAEEAGMAKRHFLETLPDGSDPFKAFLDAAPIDDEPVSAEEEAAVAEAIEEYRRGETLTLEEVKRFLAS